MQKEFQLKQATMNVGDIQNLESILNFGDDYEISPFFPPKVQSQFLPLFDCRLQLLLQGNYNILPGETKKLPTNCIISPDNGWFLSTIGNPELDLMFHEDFFTNYPYKLRVNVSLTNVTNQIRKLGDGLCIGYILLKPLEKDRVRT